MDDNCADESESALHPQLHYNANVPGELFIIGEYSFQTLIKGDNLPLLEQSQFSKLFPMISLFIQIKITSGGNPTWYGLCL